MHWAQPSPSPPRCAISETSGSPSSNPSLSPQLPITLLPSRIKHPPKSTKLFRAIRSIFRSFPIISPGCNFHANIPRGNTAHDSHIHRATCTTGTLFGHRKARITLAIQENPRSIPWLLLELGIPTAKLLQEVTSGMRIALECEKQVGSKTKLLDEPVWTAFINGRKIGYAARRDPTDSHLNIMQLLHAVSMGAGVLPDELTDPVDGQLTYMRGHFDRIIGNKDSETFYMLNPDTYSGPELSIFFIRI
ncbi:hypothetical protein J5N97_003583 [Dioscorea zingiberensis]|uniref:Protein MIZU-KUSSEI 1 n=1 Tax=Dioscorea zingiberensis TaxID=325984 RepID=A0A9D5D6E7_9LILI|nr:hypothetical protein J5N97_003583 [Dioscorea zingiberensis]